MGTNIIIRCKEPQIEMLIERFGLGYLWADTGIFEISASACITLQELRSRWTCVTESFISGKMGNHELPLAGMINHFTDDDIYQCRTIIGYFEYLTLPENHPDYAKRFPRSYQCFAHEYSIKDFVLPLCNVEAYEKAHPEVLRKTIQEPEEPTGATGPELLIEIFARLDCPQTASSPGMVVMSVGTATVRVPLAFSRAFSLGLVI